MSLCRTSMLLIAGVWTTCIMHGCNRSHPTNNAPEMAHSSAPLPSAPQAVIIDRALLQSFGPLPGVDPTLSPDKIMLGRMLYHDTLLSQTRDVSCDTCHPLTQYGAEPKAFAEGHKKQKGERNAPTVYNAAGHIAQFWDGRAKTVEEQALGPILNPKEMAMPSADAVVQRLRADPRYVAAFAKAFPEAGGGAKTITFARVGEAIGTFERTLLTPGRWDKFLQGDDQALTDQEKRGFQTFVQMGCAICHTGVYVGGSMFQKAGLVQPWPSQSDLGRYTVTHQDTDKMIFKVPSLRNVAHTGPYFHDGSISKLDEAVRLMGLHQLGKEISPEDTLFIVSFLNALSGSLPARDMISKPAMGAQ